MEFFLDVGIYALIVILAAAGAGFVVLRLLAGGGAARTGASSRSHGAASSGGDSSGGDDWDSPVRATQSPPPSSGKKAAVVTPASVSAGSQSPESGPTASGENNADSATVAALQSFETALSQEDESGGGSRGEGAVGATPAKSDVPPAKQGESHEAQAIQSVLAPPDETNEENPEDDGILAMFEANDAEESTVGDLANRLEDVDASFLLTTAMEIAASKKGKGGGHA